MRSPMAPLEREMTKSALSLGECWALAIPCCAVILHRNLALACPAQHHPLQPLLGCPAKTCAPCGCRYYGLQPNIKVISPWREWDLNSRSKLIAYAEANNISVPASKRGEPPFSMDANLLHISYEG